jgi:hypothetical protein
MKLIFRRSDALAGFGQIDDLEVNLDGDVQITSGTVRDVSKDGAEVAEINRNTGYWYVDSPEGSDSDWIGPFSDIIIKENA